LIDDLRRRAEERVREQAAEMRESGRAIASEELRPVLHDLRVHQIELEMQNEELRRTQADLEASRARYFDLYDLAPVGYFTISEKGLILEANLTAATLLGVARGALIKQPLTRFIVPGDQDRYYLHRKQLFATGARQMFDLQLQRENGAQFWARFEATVAQDADGDTQVCRAVVSDVSERKRVEDERLRFEEELREMQKAESLARMAGAIANHFNNQLGVIMGNLELLSMGEPPVDAGALSDALQAARKAAEVSRLLLTYLGQSSGNHAPLDLSEICRQSLPMLRAAMPKGVVLETELPLPGPAVNANAAQLQLMLTNLITNAWEAGCDRLTPIHLTVKTVPPAEIPTSHRFAIGWRPRDQAYACLEVIDAGHGIEEREIERIFEPFFTSRFTGRGLGLPVVLGILHAHSGGLVVESKRGRESGSAFRVYLPVSVETVVRPTNSAARDAEREEPWSGTVLLVEDEEMLRRTTRTMLARLGFTVLDAKDGLEAVEMFRLHKDTIRFVLCDVTMPHMDGWQTLAALRTLAPGVQVILTSGYDEAHVMADDYDQRPQAFLGKPYQLNALRDAIRRALGKREN
jgi:two-component system cell cycle sensor histidine kinase/response regulator CckA